MADDTFIYPSNYTRQYGTDTHEFFYSGQPGKPEDLRKYLLRITDRYGNQREYTGRQAKALAKDEAGRPLFKNISPEFRALSTRNNHDFRDSYWYKVPLSVNRSLFTDKPTRFGKTFNTPFTASVAGGAIGFGGTLLGKFLAEKFGLIPKGSYGWAPWAGLAGGTALGYLSNKGNPVSQYRSANLSKKAGWVDPRNFILEKLQRTQDIPPFKKAIIASLVRNMEKEEAYALQSLIRQALGIGVGSLLANYFSVDLPKKETYTIDNVEQ